MTRDCDDCGHSHLSFVNVGDCEYGNYVEDWDCDVLDEMTDDEVELADKGQCPYWIPMEADE